MRHDLTSSRRAPVPGVRPTWPASIMRVQLLALAAFLVMPGLAAVAGDVPAGLQTVRQDLTPEDLARVTAITAPTTDF